MTRHFYGTLGETISDIIITMSAELPPYFKPLTLLERNVVIVRLQIGVKPEYSGIETIDNNLYG